MNARGYDGASAARPAAQQEDDVSDKIPVTLIPGDGIGPEVVDAARRIIEAAGAGIEWEEHEAGAEVFKAGLPSGVPQDTMDSIAHPRRPEGPPGDTRRVRREVGECDAAQAL